LGHRVLVKYKHLYLNTVSYLSVYYIELIIDRVAVNAFLCYNNMSNKSI